MFPPEFPSTLLPPQTASLLHLPPDEHRAAGAAHRHGVDVVEEEPGGVDGAAKRLGLPELRLGRGARVAEEAHEAVVVGGEKELSVPAGVSGRDDGVVVRVAAIVPRAGYVEADGRGQVVPLLVPADVYFFST